MATDTADSARADRLGEILGAYFVALEAGRTATREELMVQHPDLAAELAEYFAEQDRLDRLLAPRLRPESRNRDRPDARSAPQRAPRFRRPQRAPVPRVLLRDTEPGPPRPLGPSFVARDARAGRSPARLQLFGEIARGGMGASSRAATSTSAATWPSRSCWSEPRRSRNGAPVHRGAQIGGQLQHPGIVPIYELGTFADRRPYFAMKLVKGRTLADLLAERPFRHRSLGDGRPEIR